jgi:hypothetical protein
MAEKSWKCYRCHKTGNKYHRCSNPNFCGVTIDRFKTKKNPIEEITSSCSCCSHERGFHFHEKYTDRLKREEEEHLACQAASSSHPDQLSLENLSLGTSSQLPLKLSTSFTETQYSKCARDNLNQDEIHALQQVNTSLHEHKDHCLLSLARRDKETSVIAMAPYYIDQIKTVLVIVPGRNKMVETQHAIQKIHRQTANYGDWNTEKEKVLHIDVYFKTFQSLTVDAATKSLINRAKPDLVIMSSTLTEDNTLNTEKFFTKYEQEHGWRPFVLFIRPGHAV